MRHSQTEYNVMGTEIESFPTMHHNYGPEYKSFKKHREISETITDFGKHKK